MTDLLASLEQLQVIHALKASYVAYPIINGLHVCAIGVLLTAVVMMDLRLLGAFAGLPEEPFVRLMRRCTLLAFCLAVATGFTLFAVRAREYAELPLFAVKLSLIALAAVNFVAFSALDRRRPAGAPISTPARLSALASIAIWISVVFAGRFLGFV